MVVKTAEHLQPGESFADAAVRGLREELSVEVDKTWLQQLTPLYLSGFQFKNGLIKDNEWKECWKCKWNGFGVDCLR